MRSKGSPSHRRYSPFRAEEGVVVNVNKKTFCVDIVTRHTDKEINDIQVLAPYHHFSNGEGIHHLPEVGAIAMIAFPSDNTPPFIMGYKGAAASEPTADSDARGNRPTPDGEGSATDVTFQSNRPDLQPGDIAITTRDENFIYLRRGGVLQLGSTPISQRLYVPILNYIKDFCENYEMGTFGGDVSWTVARDEDDPSGQAPSSYVFHMNEFAQDAKATVRVRHFPAGDTGGDQKSAWDIAISAQNIDRDTGDVSNATYTMSVLLDGTKSEFIGASRDVQIAGNDSLTVDGDMTVTVKGAAAYETTGDHTISSGANAVLHGSAVYLGERANFSVPLGELLVAYLSTLQAAANSAGATPAGPVPPNLLSQIVKVQ